MSNLTVAEVVAKYRNERINKLYRFQQDADSLPGMRELKEKKKKILQKALLDSIQENDDTGYRDELTAIERQISRLLISYPLEYGCPICRDTGISDGRYCRCLKNLIYKEAYGAAEIEKLNESFDTSDHSLFETGFKCIDGSQLDRYLKLEHYAKVYAEKFPENKKPNLFLTGNTGLGKSFILRSIAKHVYQKRFDVLLIGSVDLFSVFHRHRLGNDIDLDYLQNCELLIIDDLGVEPATQNVTVEYFLDLLNRRIDKRNHTVIATNLSNENMISRYGERVYSRIRFKEICDQLPFEGMDIRIR